MSAPKLPLFPTFRGKWSDAYTVLLNRLLSDLRAFLLAAPAMSIVDIRFRAGDDPSTQFGATAPAGVVALGLFRVDSSGPVPVAMSAPLAWSWSSGTLSITSLSGLSGSSPHVIRVMIVEVR